MSDDDYEDTSGPYGDYWKLVRHPYGSNCQFGTEIALVLAGRFGAAFRSWPDIRCRSCGQQPIDMTRQDAIVHGYIKETKA